MAKAIDKNTRLVSMAMVSNVNGFMHDVKASAIAHARGAHVFADIIQAVGAVPVDVALGIDFVRGHLQMVDGRARHASLRARRSARHGSADDEYGHGRCRTSTAHSDVGAARRGAIRDRRHPGDHGRGVNAGIDYVNKCGSPTSACTQQLTDRLQKELPPLATSRSRRSTHRRRSSRSK